MLLLGGFAIAAALSKHLIAKQMAATVLSKVRRWPCRCPAAPCCARCNQRRLSGSAWQC